MFSSPANLFRCCRGDLTHKHTEQIHSNEALCIGKPRLAVQSMNMHLEINALACDSILNRRSPDVEFKVFGFSGAFLFPKREVEIGMCAHNAAPKLALSPTARAGVPHLAYRGGFSPGSVKLDWKLNSECGLAAAGIRKFPCEEKESRRGVARRVHLASPPWCSISA